MRRSKHFSERMASRGITEREVRLAHLFGVRQRDKLILGSRTCEDVSTRVNELLSILKDSRRSDGLAKLLEFEQA